VTLDILVCSVEEDAATAESILERLRRSGWSCRPADAENSAERRPYSALVLLISRHTAGSKGVVRFVERAANQDVPIIPVRLDRSQLANTLEYFVGTIGAIDWTRAGVDGMELICEALSRRVAAYPLDRRIDAAEIMAPPFRPSIPTPPCTPSTDNRWADARATTRRTKARRAINRC
jgi:hypothetical protein